MRVALRPLLFKIHLYVAIAIAPFVVSLGLTGAIMAFETELGRVAHADVAYVTPAGPRLGFGELGRAVAAAYPGKQIVGFMPGDAPNLADRVGVGADQGGIFVYVNPYTGKILGSGGPFAEKMNAFLGAVHSIHQRLTLPRPGRDGLTRLFMSWITVAILFLALSGIYLWWPRMRFAIRAGKSFWYDLHATLGIAATGFLILLCLSGMVLGFRFMTPMMYAVTGSQPASSPRLAPLPPAGVPPIDIDRAVAIAHAAMPQATSFPIIMPAPFGTLMRAGTPGDPEGRRSQIVIGNDGKVLLASAPDSAPAGTQALELNRAIHTGTLFGLPSKIIMSLASLIVVLQVLSGIVMWIRRNPVRKLVRPLLAAALVAAIGTLSVFVTFSGRAEGNNRIEQRR